MFIAGIVYHRRWKHGFHLCEIPYSDRYHLTLFHHHELVASCAQPLAADLLRLLMALALPPSRGVVPRGYVWLDWDSRKVV